MVYIRSISSPHGAQHNESQELHSPAQLHTKAGVLRPLILGAVTARLSSTFLCQKMAQGYFLVPAQWEALGRVWGTGRRGFLLNGLRGCTRHFPSH